MDQADINSLMESQANAPQNTLNYEQSYLDQRLAPQLALAKQQQINALRQSLQDQQIMRNRLLQNAQNQYDEMHNIPSQNPWKTPTNYAEMQADNQFAEAESKRAIEYQKQIQPWMEYATKLGNKPGTELANKLMESVMSDPNAPLSIKRQLSPLADGLKSGKITLNGGGEITTRIPLTEAIKQKYNLPDAKLGSEVDIVTKENGDLVSISPTKHQTGDVLSPEALAQKIQIAQAGKTKTPEQMQQELELIAAKERLRAKTDPQLKLTRVPGVPGYAIRGDGQVMEAGPDGRMVPSSTSSKQLEDMIVNNNNRLKINAVRSGPRAAALKDALDYFEKVTPELLTLSHKIRDNNPLEKITTANQFKDWLNSKSSDPFTAAFKARLSMAQTKVATALQGSGGRGGQWLFQHAKDLLEGSTDPKALEGVLNSHLDDLQTMWDSSQRFGTATSSEDEFIRKQTAKGYDYIVNNLNKVPTEDDLKKVREAAKKEWERTHHE